jgi:hypothetical protein
MTTAIEVLRMIMNENLLNDRREYDVEDLMAAYPGLSRREAEKLEFFIRIMILKNKNINDLEY